MTASHQFQQILLFLGAFVNSIHQQGDTRTTGFVETQHSTGSQIQKVAGPGDASLLTARTRP